MNPCGEAVLVGANRATDDALDTVGRWRLDAERSAARLQLRGQPIVVARLRDGVVTEPRPERRGVGNGRLAEIEEGADFGPLSFEVRRSPTSNATGSGGSGTLSVLASRVIASGSRMSAPRGKSGDGRGRTTA